MKSILIKIFGGLTLGFGIICLIGVFYHSFTNDGFTQMQVLKDCILQIIIGTICIYIGLLKLKYFD